MLQLPVANPARAELLTATCLPADFLESIAVRPGNMVANPNLPLVPNRPQLWQFLKNGAEGRLYDQSVTEDWILRPRIKVNVDASPRMFTSSTADERLGGPSRRMALVAAFGFHRKDLSDTYVPAMSQTRMERIHLRDLGELFTDNAHHTDTRRRCIEPAELCSYFAKYQDPLHFLQSESIALKLKARRNDSQNALALPPIGKTTMSVLTSCLMFHGAIGPRIASILSLLRRHRSKRTHSSARKRWVCSGKPSSSDKA